MPKNVPITYFGDRCEKQCSKSISRLQQFSNNPFPIAGIGKYPHSNFKIVGGVAFAVSQ